MEGKMTKRFPSKMITPEPGSLGQMIFENSSVGIPLRLQYDISFSLKPFTLEEETVSTRIVLDSIKVPSRSWKHLAGMTYTFPVNPNEVYIDGSVYMFGVHNPADATRISFGKLNGLDLPVTIDLTIDFTYEGDEAYGVVPLTLKNVVKVQPLRVISWVEEECGHDPVRLSDKIRPLVDLNDFETPVVTGKSINYRPKG